MKKTVINILKRLRLRTWVAIILLAILLPIAAFALFKPSTSEASWYNDSFAFRIRLDFNNAGSAVTNQKVKFDIDTASLISASKLQANCADVRFTDSNGVLLRHYLDTGVAGCNNASSDYYVLFPEIVADDNFAYMYYGNPAAVDIGQTSQFAEATFSTTPALGSEEESEGPLAYWSLNEAADNTCEGGTNDVCDNSGQEKDGSITGATWQNEELCISRTCMNFDGTDDNITFSNTISGIQSVSFWLKIFNNSTTQEILDLNGTDYITSVNGTLTAAGFGTETIYIDGVAGATTLTPSRWHHVVITSASSFSGSAIKLAQVSASYGNIVLDEIKIYSYQRSATQVKNELLGNIEGTAVTFGGSQTNKSLSDGLLGYWKMDEVSGNANDASGNSLTLTNNGTTTYVNGKFGSGSEHVPASSQHFSTATAINDIKTVSFWTNPDTTTNYYVSLNSSAYITSSSGTLDATGFTNPKIYVNGIESTTIAANEWQFVTITSDIGLNADAFYIGRQSTNYYDGTLDEIRLYTVILNPGEINNLYSMSPLPIAYWDFDEKSGTSLYDSSGNNLSGTLAASMTNDDHIKGKFGNAIDLDGLNDDINLDSSASTVERYKSGTISFWMKQNSAQGTTLAFPFSLTQGTFDYNYTYVSVGNTTGSYADESICFGTRRNDVTLLVYCYRNGTGYFADDQWHHISIVTGDGNYMYVDGNKVSVSFNFGSTSTVEFSDISNVANMRIGSRVLSGSTTGYLHGVIDEMKIYNYARTAEQVIEDMNAGHPVAGSPIGSQTVYFAMDEGYGTTLNNQVETQQAITGTISGATWTTGTSCKINNCLDFDGTDDVTTITNTNDIDFDVGLSSGFSFTTWFNADSDGEADTGQIFQKGTNTYCRTDTETASTVSVECNLDLATTDANVNITGVSINEWHHLALVYDDASTITVFIDGVERGSNTGTGTTSTDSSNLLIGGTTTANFDGSIDEFKVYAAALTDEGVRIDFNANSAINFGTGNIENIDSLDGIVPGPIAWYDIENKNTNSTLYDISSNGNDLSLIGKTNEDWLPGKIGKSLKFNGDKTKYAGGDIYVDPGNNLTISAWVYPTVSDEVSFVTGAHESCLTSNRYWSPFEILINGGYFEYQIHQTTDCTTGFLWDIYRSSYGQLPLNKWSHISVTVSSNDTEARTVTMYVNGLSYGRSQTDNFTTTGAFSGRTYFTFIGSDGDTDQGTGENNDGFKGKIDDVKYYNSVLTSEQIRYLYDKGAPGSHWQFDECEGNIAHGTGVLDNNATITIGGTGSYTSTGTCDSGVGTEAWNGGTNGKINGSIAFDGTDDYIDLGDNSEYEFSSSTSEFSITTWIKMSALENHKTIFSKYKANTAAREYMFIIYNGKPYFLLSEDGTSSNARVEYTTNFTASIETWYHVAFTVNMATDNYRIFVNGKEESTTDSGSVISTLYAGAGRAMIGAVDYSSSSPDLFFSGSIDDLRLYNYELSSSQIKKIMNDGSVRFGD